MDGRDRTRLVEGVERQCEVVRATLAGRGFENADVIGVVCFVGAQWPRFFARPLQLRGVRILWPAVLADLLTGGGTPGAPDARSGLVRALAEALPAY